VRTSIVTKLLNIVTLHKGFNIRMESEYHPSPIDQYYVDVPLSLQPLKVYGIKKVGQFVVDLDAPTREGRLCLDSQPFSFFLKTSYICIAKLLSHL
jgi:hypothetical protein